MSDEVTLRRIEIMEARISDLEKRLNSVSAPVLDAIESFRRDTLSMFESTKAEIVEAVKTDIANPLKTDILEAVKTEVANPLKIEMESLKREVAASERRLVSVISEALAKR